MKWERQKEFEEFLIANNVVELREKKVRLSSGRHSNLYINVRKLMDDVVTLDKLIGYVKDFVYGKNLNPDYFLGVAEGMTKLGLIMTYTKAKDELMQNSYLSEGYSKKYSLPMARGRIKKYGSNRDKCFLGSLEGEAVVLEDVLTTGNSTIKLVQNMKENGAGVLAVIGLVDRLELRKDGFSVAGKFSHLGIEHYSLSDVRILLPLACENLKPSNELVRKINKYYKKYGCEV